jgi:Tfp pilus assembly protein PilO
MKLNFVALGGFLGCSILVLFLLIMPKVTQIQNIREGILIQQDNIEILDLRLENFEKQTLKFNSVSDDDLAVLDKLLPYEVDLPNLLVVMDSLITRSGLATEDIVVSTTIEEGNVAFNDTSVPSKEVARKKEDQIKEALRSTSLNVFVKGSYDSFKEFLKKTEKILRLSEVEKIRLSSPAVKENEFEGSEFSVTVKSHFVP